VSPDLGIDCAPAYELLLSLAAASNPDAYAPAASWLAAAPPDLLADIQRFTGGSDKLFPHLLPFAYQSPPPRDVPTFLAHLRAIDPTDALLHLLGYHLRYFRRASPPEVIRQAALGDRNAQRRLQLTSYPDDAPWQAALHTLLANDARTTIDTLLDLLHRWHHTVFADLEPQLLPLLHHEVETRRLLANTLSPEELIERATAGIEYAPEPGIQRVLLIPSTVSRPWVHTLDHADLKIFCYPVPEEGLAADPGAPSPRLAALTRALGDEKRLRILRLLAAGRYTLPEIAERFGVPKTTIHHHLLILRQGGLVRVRSSDRTYVVRDDAIATVSALLEEYLQGGRS
jgi:DNA-binding transcriptional ArsR family regulator